MATKIDSNQRICLIGYFSKTKNPAWLFDVFTYFLELAKQVDNPVNEFSYYKDGKHINGSCRRKGKKYDELILALSKKKQNNCMLELLHWDSQGYMLDSPFALFLNNSINEKGYGYIGVASTTTAILKADGIHNFVKNFFNTLNSIVSLRQGLIRKFHKGKVPLLYYNDSTMMASLSKEEEEEIENWVTNGKQFESLVRGVYWGNLLTDGHFDNSETRKSNTCKQLEQKCGSKVYQLNDELVLLCASKNLARKDVTEKKLRKYIKAVEKVLLANEVKLLSILK